MPVLKVNTLCSWRKIIQKQKKVYLQNTTMIFQKCQDWGSVKIHCALFDKFPKPVKIENNLDKGNNEQNIILGVRTTHLVEDHDNSTTFHQLFNFHHKNHMTY